MKKSYLLKNRERKNSQYAKTAAILVLCLVLIFIVNFSAVNFLTPIAHTVGRPFFAVRQFGLKWGGIVLSHFNSKQKLIEENEILSNELENMRVSVLRSIAIEKENNLLKGELGRNPTRDMILSYVLPGPASSPYDTFVLDVGEDHGIEKGSEIHAEGGTIVGFIEGVYSHTSLAKLYSSPGMEIDIEILSHNIIARATGRGGGDFEIKLPKNVEIKNGTLIVKPGIERTVIGIVEATSSCFIFPWWFAFLLALILLFYFNNYYEFLLAGFLLDALYGADNYLFFRFQFALSLLAVIIFLISLKFKKMLRFYS